MNGNGVERKSEKGSARELPKCVSNFVTFSLTYSRLHVIDDAHA